MTVFREFDGSVHFGKIFSESLFSWWYLYALGLLFLLILILLSGKYCRAEKVYERNIGNSLRYYNIKEFGPAFYLRQSAALLITIPVFIIGVRRGIGGTVRPITLSNAGDYAERPVQAVAVLNTPFSLIRTLGKAKFRYQNHYAGYEEMERIYTPVHRPQERSGSGGTGTDSVPGPDSLRFPSVGTIGEGTGKNIVIFILESFSAEHNYLLNPWLPRSFTPFLDSLALRGSFVRRLLRTAINP